MTLMDGPDGDSHRADAAQGCKRAGNDLDDNTRIHSLPSNIAEGLVSLAQVSRVQGAIGVNDGPDQTSHRILAVRQQLLDIFRQAVAIAWVAIERANTQPQAHAINDIAGAKAARGAMGPPEPEVSTALCTI